MEEEQAAAATPRLPAKQEEVLDAVATAYEGGTRGCGGARLREGCACGVGDGRLGDGRTRGVDTGSDDTPALPVE